MDGPRRNHERVRLNNAPRYATLRDYIRVLRRNKLLLLVAIIVFAGGAYMLTAGDPKEYDATATLAFNDVAQQTSNLLGDTAESTGSAENREELEITNLARPAIVSKVAAYLHVPSDTPALLSGISAGLSTTNNFMIITVQNASPATAQAVAHAYAVAVQEQEQEYWQGQFKIAEASLRQQLKSTLVRTNPTDYTEYLTHLTNLKFEAKVVSPVSITQDAALPTAPVGPHSIRDAILGGALGLLIGILLAFGRDALDRRLRSSDEITEELGWPILGHIREGSLGRAGFVKDHPGKPVEDADLEAFRILRQNTQLLNIDSPPRSIVISSAKPEEGKSTVAASLACASALSGKLTVVIDCDLRRPSLAAKFGVPDAPGLTDYLLGNASPAEILRTVHLGPQSFNGNGNGAIPSLPSAVVGLGPAENAFAPAPGSASNKAAPAHVLGTTLVVIPAGRRTSYPAELLTSKRLRTFLDEITAAYEMVVIDTPPVLPVADALELAPQTDAVLLCVRGSQTSAEDLRATKAALDRLPDRPIGIVVTGYRSGSEVDFGYYSYQYQYK